MNRFAYAWLCLITVAPGSSWAQFTSLVEKLPAGGNALVLIDVQGLHDCPLGREENWAKKHEQDFSGGATQIPPTVQQLVLGAKLALSNGQPDWEVGVAKLQNDPNFSVLARQEKGQLDQLEGRSTLWSPRGLLFVHLAKEVVGFITPASRQEAGRWLQAQAASNGGSLSPYLRNAAPIINDGQIVQVLDLSYTLSKNGARAAIESSRALGGRQADYDKLTNLVHGLKGVIFAIKVDNAIQGKMRIDFEESAEILGSDAKAVVLETLDRFGAGVDDFAGWSTRFSGNSVSLQGELSREGLRKILSLIEIPALSLPTGDKEVSADNQIESNSDPQRAIVAVSRKYYSTVVKLLDDLRIEAKSSQTRGQSALWHERYAKKIDRLPILNVDSELLAWGQEVAERLRSIGLSVRNANIRTGVVKAQNRDNDYYGWNYGEGYSSAGAEAQELSRGSTDRIAQWKVIDDHTAAIRLQMTQKYQAEF